MDYPMVLFLNLFVANDSYICQENIQKLYIDSSPAFKEEISVNNLIKILRIKIQPYRKLTSEDNFSLLLILKMKKNEMDQIMFQSPHPHPPKIKKITHLSDNEDRYQDLKGA